MSVSTTYENLEVTLISYSASLEYARKPLTESGILVPATKLTTLLPTLWRSLLKGLK